MRKLAVLSFWLGIVAAQQCPTTFPPSPNCDNCTPLVVQGNGQATVPANSTRCVLPNQVAQVKELDIKKNATLIVCGTLTLEGGLTVDGGATLWIAPSGGVHVQGAVIVDPSSAIYNYGRLTSQSLTLNGGGASFWNIGTNAQVQVSGAIIVNASTQFVNHAGQIQAGSLTLNGNATACMSDLACISVGSFTANGNGAIQVTGSEPVALHFTGNATLNSTVTSSDQLLVCQAPGATVNNSNNWGQAQVQTGCTSGCGVLPAQRLVVRAHREAEALRLEWTWEGVPSPVASYTLEVYALQKRQLLYTGLSQGAYISTSSLPTASEWVFQIVAWSEKGERLAQGTLVVTAERSEVRVWPTFFEESLWYIGAPEKGIAVLYDIQGRALRHLPIEADSGLWSTDIQGEPLSTLPQGVYVLVLPGERPTPVRVVKR